MRYDTIDDILHVLMVVITLLVCEHHHKRNFVVKCEGTAGCETNMLRNLKRKMWGHMAYYIPTV